MTGSDDLVFFGDLGVGGEGGGEEESVVMLVDWRREMDHAWRGCGVMSMLCRACRYVMTRGWSAWPRRVTATRASGGERGSHRGIGNSGSRGQTERPTRHSCRFGVYSSALVMMLDPTSREFKRARRHHYKSTKNRDGDTDIDWTPFRAAEKKYKARFPPPDLSGALDLALLDTRRHADIERTGWKGRPDVAQVKEVDLDVTGTRRAFAVLDVPGG